MAGGAPSQRLISSAAEQAIHGGVASASSILSPPRATVGISIALWCAAFFWLFAIATGVVIALLLS